MENIKTGAMNDIIVWKNNNKYFISSHWLNSEKKSFWNSEKLIVLDKFGCKLLMVALDENVTVIKTIDK